MSEAELGQALAQALGRRFEGPVAVNGLRRLSGGASQETWAFEAQPAGGATTSLILRRAPGGAEPAGGHAIGLAGEARVIAAARANGAVAPEVVVALEAADGAGSGYVMAKIEGETLPRRILRDAAFDGVRPGLARQCGEALARIHATPLEGLMELPRMDGPVQLARYRDLYHRYDQPKPVFELAFAWLEEELRPAERWVLVHGDFRHGNLMIDPALGLAAALDWELAHLGDPLEDLAWPCVNSWRFGVSERRVGGFGDLPDMLDAYAEAGGPRYSEADVRAWEAFGCLRWGIGCMSMYEAYRTGFDRSVERAVIGRRSSECEIDLLNLLKEARA